MSQNTKVTLFKGGTWERTVPLSELTIPSLWHIAQRLKLGKADFDYAAAADKILECWHLTHDLINHIAAQPD